MRKVIYLTPKKDGYTRFKRHFIKGKTYKAVWSASRKAYRYETERHLTMDVYPDVIDTHPYMRQVHLKNVVGGNIL